MSERGRSADPRAERVRTRLREAAFAMSHERTVDEITVGDLVARAEVSRQVFYKHFRDRDDAVALAFTHAFDRHLSGAEDEFAESIAGAAATARGHILEIFGFAAEHSPMFRNIVHSTVNRHVLSAYRDALFAPCQKIADHGMAVLESIAPLPVDAVSQFLVGGFTEVLRSWMQDPDGTDLHARVSAALDTVDALLGISAAQKGPARG